MPPQVKLVPIPSELTKDPGELELLKSDAKYEDVVTTFNHNYKKYNDARDQIKAIRDFETRMKSVVKDINSKDSILGI